jgi:hypothetical protein
MFSGLTGRKQKQGSAEAVPVGRRDMYLLFSVILL